MYMDFLQSRAKEINNFYKRDDNRFDFIVKSINDELAEVLKEKDSEKKLEELGDLFSVCYLFADIIGVKEDDVVYYTNKSFDKIINRHQEMFKLIPQNQKEELYRKVKENEQRR